MTGSIKVAVIGAGAMGRNHARVLQGIASAELSAIVDVDLARARDLARLHGGTATADVDTLLGTARPDAAIVAVPTQAHFETAERLLDAGVHVLVEKPIAASPDEARALTRRAAERGAVLVVGHVERFNPAVRELKKKLAAGALGRVFQIRARRVGPFPARIRDVGVAVDLATHDLDVMRHLTGSRLVRVFAEARREIHTSREDLVSALARFADETVGLVETNWLTPTKSRELEVTGERGTFKVDYLTQDLYFFENADATPLAWPAMSVLRGVSEGALTRFAFPKVEPLRAELEGFVAYVARVRESGLAAAGESRDVVSAADGTAALEAALAIVESARTQKVVELAG